MWSRKSYLGLDEIAFFCPWFYSRIQGWGDARWVQDFIFLFPMLINGMRRRYEFKVFLHDPRDGRILLRSSVSC